MKKMIWIPGYISSKFKKLTLSSKNLSLSLFWKGPEIATIHGQISFWNLSPYTWIYESPWIDKGKLSKAKLSKCGSYPADWSQDSSLEVTAQVQLQLCGNYEHQSVLWRVCDSRKNKLGRQFLVLVYWYVFFKWGGGLNIYVSVVFLPLNRYTTWCYANYHYNIINFFAPKCIQVGSQAEKNITLKTQWKYQTLQNTHGADKE